MTIFYSKLYFSILSWNVSAQNNWIKINKHQMFFSSLYSNKVSFDFARIGIGYFNLKYFFFSCCCFLPAEFRTWDKERDSNPISLTDITNLAFEDQSVLFNTIFSRPFSIVEAEWIVVVVAAVTHWGRLCLIVFLLSKT